MLTCFDSADFAQSRPNVHLMSHPTPAAHSHDFRGLRCPHLLIAVIAALRNVEAGAIVAVAADDLNAPSSISAWLRQSDNTLLDLHDQDGTFHFLIHCINPPIVHVQPAVRVRRPDGKHSR